jgi:hypothetical protein
MAYAPIKVSTFVRSQNAAVVAGFKDDINTYNFNSGKKFIFPERGVYMYDFVVHSISVSGYSQGILKAEVSLYC